MQVSLNSNDENNVNFMGTRFFELFGQYTEHIQKMSTEEFNYHCNLSRVGFEYYHWLAKVGSFDCQYF